jgi:hypothetical protein
MAISKSPGKWRQILADTLSEAVENNACPVCAGADPRMVPVCHHPSHQSATIPTCRQIED